MVAETKRKWPLRDAEVVAIQLIAGALADSCERIEVGGSIRRRCAQVGDIEIVCVSKDAAPLQQSLFEDAPRPWALDARVRELMDEGLLELRPNKNGVTTFGEKNKLLIHRPTGIGVDIFSTEPRYWGMTLFIRTGPKAWNVRAMAHFKNKGMEGHAYGGVTDVDGRELDCPEEHDVFLALGWSWVYPEDRR